MARDTRGGQFTAQVMPVTATTMRHEASLVAPSDGVAATGVAVAGLDVSAGAEVLAQAQSTSASGDHRCMSIS